MAEGIEELTLSPPGKLLQQKRRELNMSTGEVASMLLLSKTQIKAIESGDHEDLASATYVIGYWRNYARLLRIDIDDSIKAFKGSIDGSHKSTIRIRDNHRQAHSHQEKSRKLTAIGFLILAILCLIAIWFWQNPETSPFTGWREEPIQGTGQAAVESMKPSAEAAAPAELQTQDSLPQSVLPEPNFLEKGTELPSLILQESVEEAVPEPIGEAVEEPIEETGGGEPQSDPAGAENHDLTPVSTMPGPQDRNVSFIPAEERLVDTSGPVPDEAEFLTIHVLEQSWLDVRDYGGDKLIFRIARAGEVVKLAGSPPFAVFVENFEDVRIMYLGEQVAIQPYVEGEQYARFLLGRKAETGQ